MDPRYTTVDSVKVRLAGKVQFQSGAEPIDGELPDALLFQLITDAETDLEQELRSRYAIPFRTRSRRPYCDLPEHTKRALGSLVDMRAVALIIATDFCRSSTSDGSAASAEFEKLWTGKIDRMLGRDSEGGSRDRYRFSPPLDDLMLAPTNREADDGYKGAIVTPDSNRHNNPSSYAADQINDPSHVWPFPAWRQRQGWWR